MNPPLRVLVLLIYPAWVWGVGVWGGAGQVYLDCAWAGYILREPALTSPGFTYLPGLGVGCGGVGWAGRVYLDCAWA